MKLWPFFWVGQFFFTLSIALVSMAWFTYIKSNRIDEKIKEIEGMGFGVLERGVYSGQIQGLLIAKEILQNPPPHSSGEIADKGNKDD